jgi:hypothetical protein
MHALMLQEIMQIITNVLILLSEFTLSYKKKWIHAGRIALQLVVPNVRNIFFIIEKLLMITTNCFSWLPRGMARMASLQSLCRGTKIF